MNQKRTLSLGLCVLMFSVLTAAPIYSAQGQDNTALLKEIEGTWEYVAGYDILQVKFFVEDGKLKGAEVNEDQAVDCEQDENNKMLFRGYTPDGEAFEVEFFKDDEGSITKSKLVIGYNEAEGTKIKTD